MLSFFISLKSPPNLSLVREHLHNISLTFSFFPPSLPPFSFLVVSVFQFPLDSQAFPSFNCKRVPTKPNDELLFTHTTEKYFPFLTLSIFLCIRAFLFKKKKRKAQLSLFFTYILLLPQTFLPLPHRFLFASISQLLPFDRSIDFQRFFFFYLKSNAYSLGWKKWPHHGN